MSGEGGGHYIYMAQTWAGDVYPGPPFLGRNIRADAVRASGRHFTVRDLSSEPEGRVSIATESGACDDPVRAVCISCIGKVIVECANQSAQPHAQCPLFWCVVEEWHEFTYYVEADARSQRR